RGYPLAASRTPSVAWALVGRQVAGAREGAVLTETLGRADAKPGPSAPTRSLRSLRQGPTRAARVRSSLRSRASPYARPCGLPTGERFDEVWRAIGDVHRLEDRDASGRGTAGPMRAERPGVRPGRGVRLAGHRASRALPKAIPRYPSPSRAKRVSAAGAELRGRRGKPPRSGGRSLMPGETHTAPGADARPLGAHGACRAAPRRDPARTD